MTEKIKGKTIHYVNTREIWGGNYTKHYLIGSEKPIPTIKQVLTSFENDICAWLEKNRSLEYSVRQQKIITYLQGLKLSPTKLLQLASHMLIRMDDARFVLEQQRKFEPVIAKKLDTDRANRKNASQSRVGGKIARLNSVKKILRKEKRSGLSFKDFFDNALNGSLEDLTITVQPNKKNKILTSDFDEPIYASKATIMDWYTDCDKKNRK